MTPLAKEISEKHFSYNKKDVLAVIFDKLDEAIDDIENSRVQTIDEAWEEIDRI